MRNTKSTPTTKKRKTTKKAVTSKSFIKSKFSLRRKVLLVLLAFAAVGGSILLFVDASPTPYTVYMSPTGVDSNNGLSPTTPVKTINRVQTILQTNKPQQHVEVRIQQGTYRYQSVEWTHVIPGYTISFMPANYNYGEGIKDIGSRPVFAGSKDHRMFFRMRSNTGMTTGLRFYYLEIRNYWAAGIVLNGGEHDVNTPTGPLRRPISSGLNHNKFYGLYIRNIGNKPTGLTNGEWGYAGIQLENSSYNIIQNSVFENHVNDPGASHIHGLYIDHGSSRNNISNNRFIRISGSPIKFRNSSNYNLVDNNRFVNTGIEAAVYDSHQEGSERSRDKSTGALRGDECSSLSNVVRNNEVGTKFANDNNLPVIAFRKGGNLYPGLNPACPDLLDGQSRFSLSNNVRIKD